jgi:hypothetical protein
MALDGTYSGLQASIADFLNRSDLTSVIPDFITMAESQINRRLMKDGPVRDMMGRSDATIDDEYIAVPSDFLGAKAIYLDPNYLPLDFVSPEEIVQRKTLYPNESGDPQVFSVVGGQFQFWPWGGTGSFSGELTYWKTIPALTSTNTTNWLLTAHPDIYLYTSLVQSAPYLRDDARLQVWATLAETALSDLTEADKKARSAPHLGVGIVPGGTP